MANLTLWKASWQPLQRVPSRCSMVLDPPQRHHNFGEDIFSQSRQLWGANRYGMYPTANAVGWQARQVIRRKIEITRSKY